MTQNTKQPTHQATYVALREMILCGDLAPGQAVTIQGIAATLNTGATPVREAIRRLISEGALAFHDNRRVSVPMLNPAQIDELTFGRLALEPEMARRAAQHATPSEISNLTTMDMALDTAISNGDARAYLRLNYQFHMALYALADTPILFQAAHGLWLRTSPSLRIMCGRLGTQNLPDMHKEILSALRQHDGDTAANALRQDIEQGMDAIRTIICPP